jgi:primosomal protein N' (replication factor Y) (superfamily II helicase)
MICHYCSYEETSKRECKKCSSQSLKLRGFGTQRIEELLNERFPNANVLRMDLDTTKKKNGHIDILRKFANHEADILFGTQMITKGLDFENVTLVGVLSADLSLSIPDFRSAERSYQLFSQVAGRAGRGEKHGDVYIQSFLPDHYAVQHAKNHSYEAFYNEEIHNRLPLNYPPSYKLINIRFFSESEAEVMNVAHFFSIEFNRLSKFNVIVLGPAPALIYKIKRKISLEYAYKSSKTSKAIKRALKVPHTDKQAKI